MMPEDDGFADALRQKITKDITGLENSVGGFDFSRVLGEYFLASLAQNEEKKNACLRWLRGEFANRTEAKRELGFSVGVLVDDENWYDFIKLWALFARHIGYAGLVVYIDECIVLYKIVNRVARESNYEKLLTIFNDTLQGRAEGLGVIFGGTPQFLEDTRRGLFSYEALRSRLTDSRFSGAGFTTLSSPVIRLRRLSDNELYALLCRLDKLFAQRTGKPGRITDEERQRFLAFCLKRAGAAELVTPREIIRDYMTVLHILDENPTASLEALLKNLSGTLPPDEESAPQGAELSEARTQKNTVRLEDIEI